VPSRPLTTNLLFPQPPAQPQRQARRTTPSLWVEMRPPTATLLISVRSKEGRFQWVKGLCLMGNNRRGSDNKVIYLFIFYLFILNTTDPQQEGKGQDC
jgi:hypothetical protein